MIEERRGAAERCEGGGTVVLNSLTDELLLKIFNCVDFKTKHNAIPMVCWRWAQISKSSELWSVVTVDPCEEHTVSELPIKQSKVFRWCSQPHITIHNLKLQCLGLDLDDFTPVGMGALFGICNAALVSLEIQASRELLQDLSSLLCLINVKDLSITCVDPDPHNPFHGADVQCISGLRRLETLTLDLNLVLIPQQFSCLHELHSFSVSGTGRVPLTVPDELSSLLALKELKVNEPLWPDIPAAVYGLTGLKSLVVEGHHQYSHHLAVSSAVTRMASLKKFGVVAHRLQSAPEELGEMGFLEILDLSRNCFDERLPADVMLPISKLTRLKALNISDCGLDRIPEVLTSLTSLEELNLSGNQFVEVSHSLAHLLSLRTLLMRNCGLEVIPNAVCQIQSLELLDLSNNKITSTSHVRALVDKESFKNLVLRHDCWSPELVAAVCRIARIWGSREPSVI